MSVTTFNLDPVDLPSVIRVIRGWPQADRYPPLELGRVEIARDAYRRRGEVIRQLAPEAREVLIVQDETPMCLAGGDLKRTVAEALAGAGYDIAVYELAGGSDGSLHAEFDRLDEVIEWLRPGVPVVAPGSGTVSDLAKHACFIHDKRAGDQLALVVCPTPLSVLAYSARMAVIAKNGVKRTWPSRLPDALVFDLAALAEASRHLTLAGFGDLAPLFTSFADWQLADSLGLAEFFEPSLRILKDVRASFAQAAALLREESPKGLEMLAKMSVRGGDARRRVGAAVRVWHVTGHMLDMGAGHFGRALAEHGAHVRVGE